MHAESTSMFKTRLDKFWMNQEIIYDYQCRNSRDRKSKWNLLVIVSRLSYWSIEEAGKEATRLRWYISSRSTSGQSLMNARTCKVCVRACVCVVCTRVDRCWAELSVCRPTCCSPHQSVAAWSDSRDHSRRQVSTDIKPRPLLPSPCRHTSLSVFDACSRQFLLPAPGYD